MKEYRFFKCDEELENIFFDMELSVIEDNFKGEEIVYIVYSDLDLSSFFQEHNLEFTVKKVEETKWEEKWKDFLQAGWLTDNIYFCFDKDEKAPTEKTVRIIPALAFGTGTHATTQAAARLLEDVVDGKKVADVGCGSAILAIAAVKSGAKEVLAFDIDDLAIGNAKDNIKLNRCSNIKVWTGGIETLQESVDVVIANIITKVLKVIHDDIKALKPEYIVYSGILQEEYAEFINSINIEGYSIDAETDIKEWRGVRLKKC